MKSQQLASWIRLALASGLALLFSAATGLEWPEREKDKLGTESIPILVSEAEDQATESEEPQKNVVLELTKEKSDGNESEVETTAEESNQEEDLFTPPVTASKGALITAVIDGNPLQFGEVTVRSREGRFFRGIGSGVDIVAIDGRLHVPLADFEEPRWATALGEGRELRLILRSEVESEIRRVMDANPGATHIRGVIQKKGIENFRFQVKEIENESTPASMANPGSS